MSTKSINFLAAGAIAALMDVTSLTGARAMPIASPSVGLMAQEANSSDTGSLRSSLVQEAGWHRHDWHRRDWHRRHWHHHWH
ncbi:MAG: hypothetical protein JO310_18735 [Hyphomicrobiales bacterium]|nr:hypothetical protein [Hyphomicrobiales bacterium]